MKFLAESVEVQITSADKHLEISDISCTIFFKSSELNENEKEVGEKKLEQIGFQKQKQTDKFCNFF